MKRLLYSFRREREGERGGRDIFVFCCRVFSPENLQASLNIISLNFCILLFLHRRLGEGLEQLAGEVKGGILLLMFLLLLLLMFLLLLLLLLLLF